ncbi:MAG: hypothetical protein ACLP9C_12040 [Acidimicrobiales bacterium]
MLDHLLVDLISAIRRSFERALLQRQAVEERFQVDVFLGDVSWETSYSLPGEEQPPRVRADLSVDWPTWSQTSYRSWSIGETPEEPPEVVVEVALRIQRLAAAPPADEVLAVLPPESPVIGSESLVRSSTTIEQVRTDALGDGAPAPVRWAVEATYEGSVRFDEATLEDPSTIGPMVDVLTRWVASTLVRLADLPLTFLPPDPDEDG